MSSLNAKEQRDLEILFDMGQGYVLDFSDRTFDLFFDAELNVDIRSERYQTEGTSKAKRLRSFWKLEPDHVVAKALNALLVHEAASSRDRVPGIGKLRERGRQIADRLGSVPLPRLESVQKIAQTMNAAHLAEQVRRIETAISNDPSLAIGTAKELFETCCKTILHERGVAVSASADVPELSKATFKALRLLPEDIPNNAKGADIIKRLLSNLATVGQGIAELRNLYGTGHGRHATAAGLAPRHAKLATGATLALVTFLFETHEATKAGAHPNP